jgi:pimeloyl-ACP methyl ester carboxylesterase
LCTLQAQTAAVVAQLGFTPPVIIARSLGAFVAQSYLQSHGAAGVVLVDPFPPFPSEMASHLGSEALGLDPPAARRALWADPLAHEPELRGMFAEAVRDEWHTVGQEQSLLQQGGEGSWRAARGYSSDEAPFAFPAKAFAELMHPETCIKLEKGSVSMLVVSTGMSDLASPDIAMETADYHGAPVTWVRNSAGMMSTVYAWYDKAY